MEKRYQVFISSTFKDLEGARQEVSQALLRADCFPAGMELFPAADEEQFEFIKTVIDQSDYYIIISAGRYGSIHPETGLSYTEMEYDYAVSIGKPVIRLLHRDPKSLADEGDGQLAKLLTFRNKMSDSRMVAFWENADQLGKEVTFALLDVRKRFPRTGWVKADEMFEAISGKVNQEIDSLETTLDQLKEQLNGVRQSTSDNQNYLKSIQSEILTNAAKQVGSISGRIAGLSIAVAFLALISSFFDGSLTEFAKSLLMLQ